MVAFRRLAIDVDVVMSIIEARFGGRIDAVLGEWEASGIASANQPAPDRSSLRRWVAGALPRSQRALLGLCSALDVDPFAILVAEEHGRRLTGANAFVAARTRLWLTPGIGFARQFFGRLPHWPPTDLGPKAGPLTLYFPAGWHCVDFIHTARDRVGYYQCIELARVADELSAPRVWHFAYRPLMEIGRWLEYGVVIQTPLSTTLLNYRGQVMERPPSTAPTSVETWFGPEAAEFRIASLHPFEGRLVEYPSPGAELLRFAG